MPTPVEHLSIAEQILKSPDLPQSTRSWLDENETVCGAFFLGHIAPDVQTVSRQPRGTTHFFTLPLTVRRPAYEHMLAAHPSLAQPGALPPPHAAFLAGYVAHLLLDELWVREIFPAFGPDQSWGDWRERLLLHNALRTWLDRRGLPGLRDGMGDLLRQARPAGWLPFAADANLCRWRDLVANQLVPGAAMRTVEIFAHRARVPDAEFLALLEPEVMQEQIFSRVPLTALDEFHARALTHTHDLIVRYLNGCALGESV